MSRKMQPVFYDSIIWLTVYFIAQQMARIYLSIHLQILFHNLCLIYNHSHVFQWS